MYKAARSFNHFSHMKFVSLVRRYTKASDCKLQTVCTFSSDSVGF